MSLIFKSLKSFFFKIILTILKSNIINYFFVINNINWYIINKININNLLRKSIGFRENNFLTNSYDSSSQI
jgi:hypothetical protein